MKVLVVEDENKVGSFIVKGLTELGHEAELVPDGESALKLLSHRVFNVIVLDVNLPKMNGFELCKIIRDKQINAPVLMLTALGTTEDKLNGFEAGADDYLVKPFIFSELVARLKALNKRNTVMKATENILKVADVELNLINKTVTREGKKIQLSAREMSMLEYFIRNFGKAISRSEIIGHVWDMEFDPGTNIIDVYMNSLRKKMDKDFNTKLFHTIIGYGYSMRHESSGND